VLSLVDNTSYVCAARFSGEICVTASVDRVEFHQPIHVKELLNLVARIIYVGRSSMEVEIKVYAEDIPTGAVRHTNTCHVTMVALKDGKPTSVPPLVCRTREEKAAYIQAKLRRTTNRAQQLQTEDFLKSLDQMTDEELDKMMVEK
jgi:acyl-CoA hydrolase